MSPGFSPPASRRWTSPSISGRVGLGAAGGADVVVMLGMGGVEMPAVRAVFTAG